MTQILQTTRNLPQETLLLEPWTGLDGQGMPSYDSPVEFEANVVLYDTMRKVRQFVVEKSGSEVRVNLTLFVVGDSEIVPNEQDRVIRGDHTYVVVEKVTVSGLQYTAAEPDHYRLACRDA